KYDGCAIEVLDACRVTGAYRFVGTEAVSRDVALADRAALSENVHGDYLLLGDRLKRGEKLRLRLNAVGSLESSRALVLPTALSGRCDGATHYVTSALVGGYVIQGGAAGDEPPDGAPPPLPCARGAAR